jgi:N-acyl-L-homoserine lactone synthetase
MNFSCERQQFLPVVVGRLISFAQLILLLVILHVGRECGCCVVASVAETALESILMRMGIRNLAFLKMV